MSIAPNRPPFNRQPTPGPTRPRPISFVFSPSQRLQSFIRRILSVELSAENVVQYYNALEQLIDRILTDIRDQRRAAGLEDELPDIDFSGANTPKKVVDALNRYIANQRNSSEPDPEEEQQPTAPTNQTPTQVPPAPQIPQTPPQAPQQPAQTGGIAMPPQQPAPTDQTSTRPPPGDANFQAPGLADSPAVVVNGKRLRIIYRGKDRQVYRLPDGTFRIWAKKQWINLPGFDYRNSDAYQVPEPDNTQQPETPEETEEDTTDQNTPPQVPVPPQVPQQPRQPAPIRELPQPPPQQPAPAPSPPPQVPPQPPTAPTNQTPPRVPPAPEVPQTPPQVPTNQTPPPTGPQGLPETDQLPEGPGTATDTGNRGLGGLGGIAGPVLGTVLNRNSGNTPQTPDPQQTGGINSAPQVPQQPAPQTPGPQTPGPQTPGPQTPGPQTPGPQTPGPQTPGPQTPGPQTPGPQTPGPQTPGPQTPGSQTPGSQTPGPQTPGPQTPAPTTSSGGNSVPFSLKDAFNLATGIYTIYENKRDRDAYNREIAENSRARQEALDFIRSSRRQSRNDILNLYPSAQRTRQRGIAANLDFIKQALPVELDLYQQGNLAAQKALSDSLPQIQNALFGNPVDYSNFQPTYVDTGGINALLQNANVPPVESYDGTYYLGHPAQGQYNNVVPIPGIAQNTQNQQNQQNQQNRLPGNLPFDLSNIPSFI